MTSIIQGKRGPMRTPKRAPAADHFRGTYLDCAPKVSRAVARAAALTVLTHTPDDAVARDLLVALGVLGLAR